MNQETINLLAHKAEVKIDKLNESKLKSDFRYLKAANLEELLAQMREQGYDVLEFNLPKNY